MKTHRNSSEESFREKISIISRKIIFVFLWLAIWEVVAVYMDSPILLVTPVKVVRELAALACTDVFWLSVMGTLMRVAAGFFAGMILAVIIAGIAYSYSWVDEFVKPIITVMKTVPVASFVVILLIWWGSNLLSGIISFLVVFPNLYINLLSGLKNVDKSLIEMARVYKISKRNRFWWIYRPSIESSVMSGLEFSLGMCWKSGVAAEVIGQPKGSIGGRLYLSKIYLDTAGVLAWTVVIIIVSYIFEKIVCLWSRKFFELVPKRCCQFDRRIGNGGSEVVVKALYKRYNENVLWENFSMEYTSGGIYRINMPTGSGKTTLFRMLCALESPDSAELIKCEDCCIMFQEDRLCEKYSGEINVAMVSGNLESARDAIISIVGEEAVGKSCRKLSGGMKRCVSLVRAMESDCRVLLLDEPFTGMDEETRLRAENYITEHQEGRTIIIASHI